MDIGISRFDSTRRVILLSGLVCYNILFLFFLRGDTTGKWDVWCAIAWVAFGCFILYADYAVADILSNFRILLYIPVACVYRYGFHVLGDGVLPLLAIMPILISGVMSVHDYVHKWHVSSYISQKYMGISMQYVLSLIVVVLHASLVSIIFGDLAGFIAMLSVAIMYVVTVVLIVYVSRISIFLTLSAIAGVILGTLGSLSALNVLYDILAIVHFLAFSVYQMFCHLGTISLRRVRNE